MSIAPRGMNRSPRMKVLSSFTVYCLYLVMSMFLTTSLVILFMLKKYSWKTWESQARSMALEGEGSQGSTGNSKKSLRRLTTFVFHHTSHPWSNNKILVWVLCFIRIFWSSINRADFIALRFGFLTTHQLHLAYDFHNYMLRSMDDEFRDIVGIRYSSL
ncbi:hypothetical protein MKW98_000414 [Papaver atlanticum]|uniref:Uncharacterized protein n=1 Tax=Papaver atlanticum TaxID=357466 RepID=A0AAD4X8M3_9MAGN|nr:hypothetical protein MKW98_000414 [Papaver atlanticum]